MKLKVIFIVFFICIGIFQAGLFAQGTVTVSGKVIDTATGLPLQGVQISELSSSQCVLSDIDGNYKIELNPGNVNLLFQHPYYTSQIQKSLLNEEAVFNFNVELEEDLLGLSEIVTPIYTERNNTVIPAISVQAMESIPSNTEELLQLQQFLRLVLPTYIF